MITDYKQSYYTIITDFVDKDNSKQILFATRTGTAFVVESEIIEALQTSSFDNIPVAVLQQLLIAEAIVPTEENELFELTERSKILATTTNENLNFTIMTSANCQLGCDYCGQEHTKHGMSPALVDNIIKRFEYKLSNKHFKQVDISWFGGEPLMSWNTMRTLTPELQKIAEANNCKFRSHVVTNGLSLKSNIYEELAREMSCHLIEITLDGTKNYHDERRNTKHKEDTFDIIFGNLLRIINLDDYPINNCKMSIRCNVDDRNKQGVSPLIDLLVEHGLQDKVRFYTAPVYHWGNNAHLLTTKEEYSNNEIDWFIEMYNKGFNFSILPNTRPVVCSAVTPDYELIDPWGKVYNCTETPLVPFYGNEYVIGDIAKDVHDVKPFNERPYIDWYDKIRDKDNNLYCTTCKILPLCGGRCPKSWEDGVPPCPSMKFNMKDRLVLSFIHTKTDINELI